MCDLEEKGMKELKVNKKDRHIKIFVRVDRKQRVIIEYLLLPSPSIKL